jgi:hypothetical protein
VAKGNNVGIPNDSANNSVTMNHLSSPSTPMCSSQRGSQAENSGNTPNMVSKANAVPASSGQQAYVLQSSPLSAYSPQTPPAPTLAKRKSHNTENPIAKRIKPESSVPREMVGPKEHINGAARRGAEPHL